MIKSLMKIWLVGFIAFVGYVIIQDKKPEEIANKAVVFTGDYGRIYKGVELLKEGKIIKLYITGVNNAINTQSEKELFGDIDYDEYKTSIILGRDATTTEENGEEIKEWFSKEDKVYLITSNYHMPRSELIASKYSDAEFVKYPVNGTKLLSVRGLKILFSEYHKFVFVWVNGLIKEYIS